MHIAYAYFIENQRIKLMRMKMNAGSHKNLPINTPDQWQTGIVDKKSKLAKLKIPWMNTPI